MYGLIKTLLVTLYLDLDHHDLSQLGDTSIYFLHFLKHIVEVLA